MIWVDDYKLWRTEQPNGAMVSIAKPGKRYGQVELDLIKTDYNLDDQAAEEIEALFTKMSDKPLGKRFVNDGNKVMHVGHTVSFHNRLPKEHEQETAQALWHIATRFLERRQGSRSDRLPPLS